MTAYLFSCADRFSENLEILLDFVQSPYFTEETVRKEQGIIGQEIRMYKDSADWEVAFNLLRALYHNHPVRIDIAGTEQTIAAISAELLHGCYRNFYNLGNMVLCVAGKATAEEVLAVADKVLKSESGKPAVRDYVPEPPEPKQSYIEERLPVTTPTFVLGYKEPIASPERTAKEILCTEIALEAIAGKSSALYRDLMEQGLVNNGFGANYFHGFGYADMEFSSESRDPQKASQIIRDAVKDVRARGIDPESFERARRKLYGRMVMRYNDVEDIAVQMAETFFAGESVFEAAQVIRTLTADDVNARLRDILQDEYTALSVILPVDRKDA